MSSSTVLSVFAVLLISSVQPTQAVESLPCFTDISDQTVNEGAGRVLVELDTTPKGFKIIDVSTGRYDRYGVSLIFENQTRSTYSFRINDDTLPEETESFTISLSGPNVCKTVKTIFIIDNDFYSTWTEWTAGPCSVTCGPGNRTETRTRTCIAINQTNCVESLDETRSNGACYGGPCTGGRISLVNLVEDELNTTLVLKFTPEGGSEEFITFSFILLNTAEEVVDFSIFVNQTITFFPGLNEFTFGAGVTDESWSEWSDDGTCSTTCGPGTRIQSRTRTCSQSSCCSANLNETRTVDCESCACPASTWSKWSGWPNGKRLYRGWKRSRRSARKRLPRRWPRRMARKRWPSGR